jgi:hypothetical protein
VTTPSIAEQPGAARQGGARTARRTASTSADEALRAQSHASLTVLVTALGYPPHWADELERLAFAAGRVWTSRPAETMTGHADGSTTPTSLDDRSE